MNYFETSPDFVRSWPRDCRAEGEEMSDLAQLLRPLELGYWLMVAGGVLIVLGVLGLLIRRTRRTGSEVEDEVTRRPDARLNQTETPSERAEDRPFGRDGS
jgi:hypothetical protein